MQKNFRGKKVLVMGLGLHGGGIGAVKFLYKEGAEVTVTDLLSRAVLKTSLEQLKSCPKVTYVLGKHRDKDFTTTDLIVKNPGVAPDSRFLALAKTHGIAITSDVGIFFQHSPARSIGITGTRGKSTTAFLLSEFLRVKKGTGRIFLAGNIRKSVLELLPRLRAKDTVILELSSFQLQDLDAEQVSPHIAAVTNIMNDHLNRHKDMREYMRAKSVIFRYQTADDVLFMPARGMQKEFLKRTRAARARVVRTALPQELAKTVDERVGRHYRSSVGIAVAIAMHCGVSMPTIQNVLRKFRGLEGREEELDPRHAVRFINDTTATIPEASIAAIERFAAQGALVLIAGGSDKKLAFTDMAEVIARRVAHLILLPGDASKKLQQELRTRNYQFSEARSMRAAVERAYQYALDIPRARNAIVLLSPGATSFGLFSNEFDRGAQFNEAVKKL